MIPVSDRISLQAEMVKRRCRFVVGLYLFSGGCAETVARTVQASSSVLALCVVRLSPLFAFQI